jgi:methionine-rich copper-binding protein CopC
MRILIIATTALLGLIDASAAEAHASLDHAMPSAGSTVNTAPGEITLWFTENLEPAFSTVEVRDADGAKVDLGKTQTSATVMRIVLKPSLRPGTYKVHWRATTVDTHTTEGSFSFRVRQP